MEFIYLEFIFMSNDYALWILFGIFVGIALSIDLGLFGKFKNIIIKQKEKNTIHNTLNKTYSILIMNLLKNYNNKLEML